MTPPMQLLQRIPFRVYLLVMFLIALGASAINPTDRSDFFIEHLPTIAFLIFLVILDRRSGPLSNASYLLLFFFLLLHVLGAHHLYQNVPYDRWSEAIFGRSMSETFDWERNHYDRLVHFLFGVLMVKPMQEAVERWFAVSFGRSLVIAVTFLIVLSSLYELAEWGLTVVMDPESAENYNGQQGDVFDPQKDMALALVGKVIGAGALLAIHRFRS